ncbi:MULTISPECIES: ABC transporter permease [unclassified Imperialibacter]|uniref:cell division protein FtsX n=1 Tax=unclassified Imperialibacter TaxID=2629706 RepID=UPI00125A2260|nr:MULTISPECIES: ABC transporter permease [unclassified Imperialibacter]CAD5257998.1 Cell division protein FtsX [Imperialibacter sp. 89]CAD5273049.1 Cell division protein FtsX [Imperialibacter sp. 75]VVT32569.1 Cell division protein FtsX [Imperialibacter sp. EC-SDR9]
MATYEKKVRKKKKLGSYPFVSVVFSISLALFVLGLFGVFFLLTNNLTSFIQDNIEVQVYLNKNVTESEKIQLQKTLADKDYVAKKEGSHVVLISKEEAAKEFIKETGEDFTQFIGDNPLRDLIILKITPDYQSTEKLAQIKSELESIRGVFEVVYLDNLVESINKNLTKIGLVLIGFSAILLLVVIILINNTIKLALFSQRFLIRSMQLVGATAGFIQKPFLMRATFYGLLSAIIASVGLFVLLKYANSKIENLADLQRTDEVMILFGSLLLVGMLVGFGSTYRAINKYLKMSLDELY